MNKAWRNPRQVIIHETSLEAEDAHRVQQVITLLAGAVERLLAKECEAPAEPVDFCEGVPPTTDAPDPSRREADL